MLPILITSLNNIFLLIGWENVPFELGSERDKLAKNISGTGTHIENLGISGLPSL